MKWSKSITEFPEKEDYNEICFSLDEMIEAVKAGKEMGGDHMIGIWTYFFKKYNIDLTKYIKIKD